MSTTPETLPSTPRVLVGALHRQRALSVSLTAEASPGRPAPVRRPARVARLLALAHYLQRAIERGALADRATAADCVHLTRARVTQILDLLLLAPDIQEAVLHLEAVDGVEPISEHRLRPIVRERSWRSQRTVWQQVIAARRQQPHSG